MKKPSTTELLESLIKIVEQDGEGKLCSVINTTPEGQSRDYLCSGVNCSRCPFDQDKNKVVLQKLKALIPLTQAVDLIEP